MAIPTLFVTLAILLGHLAVALVIYLVTARRRQSSKSVVNSYDD
ncbi:hypothetical protein [Baaleninema sp.]